MSKQDAPAADIGPMIDTLPDEVELRSAVYQLVKQFTDHACPAGHVPGVGTEAWWAAPADTQLAAVLTLGLAWLVHDPDQAVLQRLRQMSWDLSAAVDWSTIARQRVPHTELQRRRAEPGPMARTVDPAAAQQWAATGSSNGEGTPG